MSQNVRQTERDGGLTINRRAVLKVTAMTGAIGVVGVPTFSGRALAQELESCGELDLYCAIDVSGSLSASERNNLEAGVNAFIDALPTDGSVLVGTFEYGNNELRNKNDLQNPSGLDVTVGTPGGNTPMAAALDVADQALYTDSAQRSDAIKLIVLFTDGGPNYRNRQYSVDGLVAPRDDSTDWSVESGDTPPAYDNEGTAATGDSGRQVTVGEMDETALVAASIKSATVGDGATTIATVYVGDAGEDTQAMGTDAQTKYTDLPTYLETTIASSDFAVDVDIANVEGLVDDLVAILEEIECCTDCPEDLYVKYEWVEGDSAGDCNGEFVRYDADDEMVDGVDGVSLVAVTCDDDGEPQEAVFETTICDFQYDVKAGRGTETVDVSFEETGGEFTVTGITTTNPAGKERTHAISNIVFTCDGTGDDEGDGPGNGRGRPSQ